VNHEPIFHYSKISLFIALCSWFIVDRQPDRKEGTVTRAAADLDLTMVLVDDPMGDGKAEANPSLLRREEGVEQFIHIFGDNTRPGILDGKANPLAIFGFPA
jgi:hypothetical protein